jgi:hypothetical protein
VYSKAIFRLGTDIMLPVQVTHFRWAVPGTYFLAFFLGVTTVADLIFKPCRQPDKLDELNLDAFAEELERQGFGNKQITLYDIRSELNHMYKDNR